MPLFIGRVRRMAPESSDGGFTPFGAMGECPAWLFGHTPMATRALDSGAPVLCSWRQMGLVAVTDRVGILSPSQSPVGPSMADPPDAGTPAAQGTAVHILSSVFKPSNVRGNLWLTSTGSCSGDPDYCPSYLQPADAGVATNLNLVAGTGEQVDITATDTGTNIGGIPVITVTSAVPSGIVSTGAPPGGGAIAGVPPGVAATLNPLLQSLGLSIPDVLSALNQAGIQVQFA